MESKARDHKTSERNRDVYMLILGAIITFVSTISITLLTNWYNNSQNEKAKKFSIIEHLGQESQLRSTLINDLYNAKGDYKRNPTKDNKILLDSAYRRCTMARLRYDAGSVVYYTELKKFFRVADRNYFNQNIYNKLVAIGLFVELDNDQYVNGKTYGPERMSVENNIQAFCDQLYNQVN